MGYLITSLISNGVAVRPLSAYVFFIILAYIYLTTYETSKLFYE